MELGHEEVDVVARVADQRDALGIARDVVRLTGVVSADQLRRVFALVEVWTPHRSAAVDALEVDPRCAEVTDRVRVGVMGNGRAVGGDVVRERLPESGQPAASRASSLPASA